MKARAEHATSVRLTYRKPSGGKRHVELEGHEVGTRNLRAREARRVLVECGLHRVPAPDFFVLSSSQVSELLEYADLWRYRKPKNANGSRGRYFYAYLLRLTRREV